MSKAEMEGLAAFPIIEKTMEMVGVLFFDGISTFWWDLGLPDGGNGGDGGDVYFRSTGRLASLYDLRRAHFLGNNGKPGLVNYPT